MNRRELMHDTYRMSKEAAGTTKKEISESTGSRVGRNVWWVVAIKRKT